MTTITELENKLEALSHQHRIGSTTHDESRFEAYKANPELVKRIALRKNILKWHERLVSICNQSVIQARSHSATPRPRSPRRRAARTQRGAQGGWRGRSGVYQRTAGDA